MAKILILSAIAQVFALAIIAKVMQQTEAVNLIVQKAAFVNVYRDVEKVLSLPSSCVAALQSATINESRLADKGYRIPLLSILEPGPVNRSVVAVGQTAHGMSARTRVDSIEIGSIKKIAAEIFEAELYIEAKLQSAPLNTYPVRLSIQTDPQSPAEAKTVRSCTTAGASSPGAPGTCRMVEAEATDTGEAWVNCAAREQRLSGGGSCTDGFLSMSEPVESENLAGWRVDCLSRTQADTARARAFAYCCSL